MSRYDISNIFEYHPVAIETIPGGTISSIKVRNRAFSRYVFRPIAGHDILKIQIPGEYGYSYIQHDSTKYSIASQEELRDYIEYDLHDYDRKNWAPLAIKMSAYIREFVEDEEEFRLDVEEGRGELYIMDERNGWSNDSQQQRTTDTCSICLENISDQVNARMGLSCGHVFDKECLTEWIWTKPHCPICRATISDIDIHDN